MVSKNFGQTAIIHSPCLNLIITERKFKKQNYFGYKILEVVDVGADQTGGVDDPMY